MWLLCIAFAAAQLLGGNAQDSLYTTSTTTAYIATSTSTVTKRVTDSSTSSQSFDCFGRNTIPRPSIPPDPPLLATASPCEFLGPSPIPSVAAAWSSWQTLYSSWYISNGAAMTSYWLSREEYQSSASTLAECASLFTTSGPYIITGSTFATDYEWSDPVSYLSSSCSASLASKQASSNILTSAASKSSGTSISTRTFTYSSVPSSKAPPIPTTDVIMTFGASLSSSASGASSTSSATSPGTRCEPFSPGALYVIAGSMVAGLVKLNIF